MRLHSLANKNRLGTQQKIALQLLPYKMKLIMAKPYIGTCAGDNIFLFTRAPFRSALQRCIAYIALPVKHTQGIVLAPGIAHDNKKTGTQKRVRQVMAH